MDLATALRRLRVVCRSPEGGAAVLTALLDLVGPLDDDVRAALLRHAYWHEVEVPTEALVLAAGGHEALRSIAGRGPIVASCRGCGRAVRAVDRDSVAVGAGVVECDGCGSRSAPARSVVADPAPPWEFEPLPTPWRSRPLPRMVAGRRQWAEDYPERRPA